LIVVVCRKCGAKNNISGVIDPKKSYHCGKCGTRLPIPREIQRTEAPKAVITGHRETSRPQDAQIRKSTRSYFLLTPIAGWFKIREHQMIFLLVLVALLLHLYVVPYTHLFVFDEKYYVPEAGSIIHQRALLNPEHPSLGKLFIASGILALGDNPWGWRIPSVLFGVASIVIFYLVCRRLANKEVALFASFLLVFEGLTFVISGLAMLDVFSVTFMLLAFLFYLHDRYVFSGISLALSAVCKLTGLLGILVILAHLLIQKRRRSLRNIALFILVVLAAFMVLLPATDYLATGHWNSPIHRVSQMEDISRNRTFAILTPEQHKFASYPWKWITSLTPYAFENQIDFKLIINPTILVLIIPAMGYMLYEFVRRKTDASLFVLLWFTATYLLWIPLVLLTDRVTYIYYFCQTVGAVCIGLGFALKGIWDFASKRAAVEERRMIKLGVIAYLAFTAIYFLYLTPIIPEFLHAAGRSLPSNVIR
jgi:dolichyl-phosphate-mannose-protein mannosyltransferase